MDHEESGSPLFNIITFMDNNHCLFIDIVIGVGEVHSDIFDKKRVRINAYGGQMNERNTRSK